MALMNKQKLSASVDGRQIKVAATASPGTTIHTAQAGTLQDQFDEIWLWAMNSDNAARSLTIQFGGTTAPDDSITLTLQPTSGLILIVPGLVLQNGDLVKAFAAATNVVMIAGFVNKLTP